MEELKEFERKKLNNIENLSKDIVLKKAGIDFLKNTSKYNYTYNFTWMGVPIIQVPQDMIAMQEIIWEVKPDLIIETGIAHGGSLIFYASLLEMIGKGEIVGIDIDIRDHNREVIENHPMFKRIKLIEGPSTSENVLNQVENIVEKNQKVLVSLDSDHTHDHVLKELVSYSKFVSQNSYVVVFDTAIEDMPEDFFSNKNWGKGNNPKTAVWEFLKNNDKFVIDKNIENKLLITVAPDGYLKRIK
ncbi:MAG: cephalosporin hydroxylase [Cytophagales bacterium]|nr:cephalosporin hydroxylase [Cytophagales bacterium]